MLGYDFFSAKFCTALTNKTKSNADMSHDISQLLEFTKDIERFG